MWDACCEELIYIYEDIKKTALVANVLKWIVRLRVQHMHMCGRMQSFGQYVKLNFIYLFSEAGPNDTHPKIYVQKQSNIKSYYYCYDGKS